MTISFRRNAKQRFARLLDHWRQVEFDIKRAEQVDKKAVIPAINELRYASRQLYFGLRTYAKGTLSPGDISSIRRRLIVAEQYLLNAEHDVSDSILTYYSAMIERIRSQYGAPEITIHYPEFPLLCKRLLECDELVRESRLDYEKRTENYNKVRREHFDFFIGAFEDLQNAEINAAYDKAKLQREIELAKKTVTAWQIVSLVLAILSVALGGLGAWLGWLALA